MRMPQCPCSVHAVCPVDVHGLNRYYRGTLGQARQAVQLWNGLSPPPLFVAQLGDLIDGQNAGTYGAGLGFSSPQSDGAWARVTEVLAECRAPMLHAIGNHELYNYDWAALKNRLTRREATKEAEGKGGAKGEAEGKGEGKGASKSEDEGGAVPAVGGRVATPPQPMGWRATADGAEGPEAFSFAVRPREGWTVLVLNSYEVSLMQEEGLPGRVEAVRLLREYNPNEVLAAQGVNFFANLEGSKARHMPFNGHPEPKPEPEPEPEPERKTRS